MRERDMIVRVVAVALLLYALGSFTNARWELERQQTETRRLETLREDLLAQRRALEERLALADDPAQMRRLAWEKLRMVMPDETVFAFARSG